ncbi:MAG TPA: 3-hydroxybutyrate dehydrogenase [Anaerolineae bacterium]|nr:3-hydroxybutyrate dehydrogenase [Anaerolineae bacterium]
MGDNVIQDKVAVVTGGASGIGLAIAERFAADGAKVVVSDINPEAGQAAADRLGGMFVQGDLSQRVACKMLIDRTVDAFGTVHILVNNAGFQHIEAVEEFPEDTWDKMIALMLTAPFLLTRYAWPYMKQQKWGRVVNMSSIHGVIASPFKAGYISAKHGMIGLTRTTALEGGPHGITVNAICPAYVRTPLVENQIADQARTRGLSEEEVIQNVMLEPAAIKRLIEPSEVAALVAYLCQDEAGVISGSPIMIDLAWTAK